MIAQDEHDVTKLIDSISKVLEETLDSIQFTKSDFKLQTHEHKLRYDSDTPFECAKLKGFKKCLSALDDEGKVKSSFSFVCRDCGIKDSEQQGVYVYELCE